MKALADYGPGGVSVILAANEPGRVEPFVFTDRGDAERAADRLTETDGVATVVLWHGVEVMGTHAAQRFGFGLRGLS